MIVHAYMVMCHGFTMTLHHQIMTRHQFTMAVHVYTITRHAFPGGSVDGTPALSRHQAGFPENFA
jgi:hypothetical protein